MENKFQEALEYFVGATIPPNITYEEVALIDGEETAKHLMALQELIDNYSKLEKALDKACDLLEISMSKLPIKYIPEDVDVFNRRYELRGNNIISNSLKNSEEWEEYLLEESEKE